VKVGKTRDNAHPARDSADILPGIGPTGRRSTAPIVAACFLIFAVVALYYPALGHPFSDYDDDFYVTGNSHVRAGLTWNTAMWAFSSGENANWHPLTWISHELDVRLFGMKPGGHHGSSVSLHALNAMLLFLLCATATERFGASLLVALLFAVHPLNVESVVWVAERKNVLSTFFFFLTLGAYGWYVRKPSTQRCLVVVSLFLCGLMSKPMVVTLPFVLLLLDYWPLERFKNNGSFWRLVREKVPLFALAFVSCVVTYAVQKAGHAFHPATQYPMAVRLANAIVAYVLYLWKALWPAQLAPFYPHPGTGIPWWEPVASLCVLATITCLALTMREKKYLLVGWLWFLGTAVPVIGIVQVGDQAMADRYAYIPLVGVFLAIAWACTDFLHSRSAPRKLGGGLALVVLGMYAFASAKQVGYWSNNTELWSHTLAVTENNWLAHRKLAWILISSGNPVRALPHFRLAAEISPNDPTNHINLGLCLDENRQPEEAIAEYRKAISLTSDAMQLASAYTDLGIDLDATGNSAEAQDSYNRALGLNPKMFNAYFDRGLLFEKQGQMEKAIQDYQCAVQLQPSVQGYLQLSHALQQLNRREEAQAYYLKARQLDSTSSHGSR
jgi:tetratricopeptide (TPR) repeat protein